MLKEYDFDMERMRTHPAETLRRIADLIDAGEIVEIRPAVCFLSEDDEFRMTMRYKIASLQRMRPTTAECSAVQNGKETL